jgi:hydrogenase nickel incorporation protein HypA/HybF
MYICINSDKFMHELSIAQSIVELAEREARNHHAVSIEELELEIGVLAGVDPIALEFALESAIKGSLLEDARIVRQQIAGEGRCGDCENLFTMENLLSACPLCGSYAVMIIKGKELRIKSLVIK